MELSCLGAGQEVGRSGFLIKGKDRLLFDYGLKLNPKVCDIEEEEVVENAEKPLSIKGKVDAIILSHAHLDHSGEIPALYKNKDIPLFLTEPTQLLSNLLWKDTIKIAKFNRTDASFNKEDIREANDSCFNLDFRTEIDITDNTKLSFYNAGHIVGSSISIAEMGNKKIMYTGDFRASPSQLFEGYDRKLPEVDYLLIESTYSTENHKNRKITEKKFIEEILETLEEGKNVMIPAFAIERSQEIIALLGKYRINAPIYLDGMSVKATKIFLDYPEYFRDYKTFKKAVDKVEFITKHKQRKKVISEPSIIITTAGMLEGGPIMYYLKELGDDPHNKILLTGYQVEGTNGKRLLETGKIYIDKEIYQPKAKVKQFSFSAHAGKDELIKFVKKVNPEKVVCIHGDADSVLSFKKELKANGFKAEAPKTGDKLILD